MKLKAQLVKREIAGDTILVPVGETTTKLQGLLTINETGAAIWDALPEAENEVLLVENQFAIGALPEVGENITVRYVWSAEAAGAVRQNAMMERLRADARFAA